MVEINKQPGLVGSFIRQRREAQGLSQRALGLLFNPPVTTQFISNVERGVTPLPPTHVPILSRALLISESELLMLLEREYTLKLSGRLGKAEKPSAPFSASDVSTTLTVAHSDFEFFRSLYDAYRKADPKAQQAFAAVCESLLKVSKAPSE